MHQTPAVAKKDSPEHPSCKHASPSAVAATPKSVSDIKFFPIAPELEKILWVALADGINL
jgi:hypothetical protein